MRKLSKRQKELLRVVRELPGVTAVTAYQLMEDRLRPKTIAEVSQALAVLAKRGLLVRERQGDRPDEMKGVRPFEYTINPEPPSQTVPISRTSPTKAGYEARIDALSAEIDELKQWQARAIERCPELCVSRLVIRAREIVARQFESQGDKQSAQGVRLGNFDEKPIMLVTVTALEEAT